jgi:hypothetical protein
MPVRERSRIDYYAVLGIHPDASHDEVAASYRALAKSLHPDTGPLEPGAAERFKLVTAAYRVLGDAARRQRYDRQRLLAVRVAGDAEIVREPTRPREHRILQTRRGARWAVGGGIALVVVGVVVSALVIVLQVRDRALRDRGVPATATVVARDGERRLAFTTADGRAVTAPEPLRTGTGDTPIGGQVEIRYDPDRPGDVVTDESKIARDLTLWIVAVKLLVAGGIFVGFGWHRLRDESSGVPS